MRESLIQLIEQVCRFVQIWEPEKLELPSETRKGDSKGGRKHRVLRQLRGSTRVVCVPSVNGIFTSVGIVRLSKYVAEELGLIHECYVAEITE